MYHLNESGFPCEREYSLAEEALSATLFTTGNGYMGIRGSAEEYASVRIQGAFVRGFIDEIIEVCEPFADNEYMKKYYLDEDGLKHFDRQESCINLPDFLMVRIEIGGKTFFPWEGKVISWERYLDTRSAELVRRVVWDNGEGAVTEFVFRRFASFACQHLYCQQVVVRPIGHALPVRIISGVDTAVKTGGQIVTRADACETEKADIVLSFHTTNKYCFAASYVIRNRFPDGKMCAPYRECGRVGIAVACDRAEEYLFEKMTFIGTQRDTCSDVEEWARKTAYENFPASYAEARRQHLDAYRAYFSAMDIAIEGDAEADGWLRFANYHTAISAPRSDSVHGISAKGLTGERYNQFVWWDCEIYQLPFFLFTAPETAKNTLLYRYHCLGQSRRNAILAGYKGAKFAFCSSVTGEERVWPYARHPFLQEHINSDIAYGIIQYYDVTSDNDFMLKYGMEMLSEIIRYWMSRVTERNGRYEILRVTGTDEHHPYVDNDAYTNYSVQYVFSRFLRLSDKFGTNLTEEEKGLAADISARLYLPREESGLIPQFDGYFALSRSLEESGRATLKQFQMKSCGLYHKSQIIKQPDVMLLYTYLNVGMDRTHYRENWDYYEKICETSSSLTFPVHAIASIQNGRILSFYEYFMQTLKVDSDDLFGVAWQGVHSGCLAGGYLCILYGLFGVCVSESGICFSPNPMPLFGKVSMRMRCRGRSLCLVMEKNRVSVRLEEGAPIHVICNGQKKTETELIDEVIFDV